MRPVNWLYALLNLTIVRASFWTVTSNYEYQLTTSTYTFWSTPDYYTGTTTRTISKGVTPTSTAVSSTTYSITYQDLEIVSVFYPPGAVEDSDLVPTGSIEYSARGDTIFLMPVTYTAPASCPTPFTYSTEEVVLPPTEVIDQITPSTVVTDAPYTYATYTAMGYETWYLTPEAVPFTTTEEYYYSVYIANCQKPDSYDPQDSITVCSWYSGCTSLRVWVIVIATILPALFVFGFLESWFWFRRLMLGKGALRFGTVCWIMISLWVACFTRTQSSRSQEDQKLLREKWNQTSGWTAFKLWWKWGFRHRYPEELLGQYSKNTVGIVPPGAPMPAPGQAVYGQPMMNQQGQVIMPPPAYMNQNGISTAPGQPVYYEAGKEGANVREMQAPMSTQSPPPQVPSPTIPTPTMSPPVPPGQYPSQGPSPVHGTYPTQGIPPSEMPHAPQSPPPSEMPHPIQSPPPSEMPHPTHSPPPQSPPPGQGPPPAHQ